MKLFASVITVFLTVAVTHSANAQTSTKTLAVTGGTGATGTIGGVITTTIKPQTDDATVQTGATLDITDLDIETVNTGSFFNPSFFPNSTSNNNTASAPIAIANNSIGINIPTTPFASPVSGSVTVTAGDGLTGVAGVIDAVVGSDGAWDDFNNTGHLNNGTVDSASLVLDNDITSPATVTGGLAFSVPNDILIPNVVDTLIIDADLRVKNTTTVDINFDPVQNLALKSFSVSSSVPVALTTPVSNFVEASHPSGVPQDDLSASGVAFIASTVSGVLSADLTGTVVGSIDLAADINVFGFIDFTEDIDNAIDGNLSDPGISLLALNETIALSGVDLPFLYTILHEPTADVDFDDVVAMIQSGTLGFTVPVAINEEVVLTLPQLEFELSNLVFSTGSGLTAGDVIIHHLAAEVSGQIVMDIDADLDLNLDVVAEAFQSSAFNVVPEPGSMTFLAIGCCAISGVRSRRRRS